MLNGFLRVIKKILKSTVRFIQKRKFISGVLFIVLVASGYWGIKNLTNNKNQTNYVLAAVEKGTLITSVSGSGQVSASNQVEIKPKTSGDIVGVYANLGKEVGQGSLLVQIDSTQAQKAVRNAQTDLETSQLELDNLLSPVDELTLFQAQNSLRNAQDSLQTSQDNLKKAYEDGFNTVSNTFLNLPSVISGLNDILFGYGFSSIQTNLNYYGDAAGRYNGLAFQYRDDANGAFQKARFSYDINFQNYKSTSRFSSTSSIEALIDETYENAKNIAEAVKSANNLIQFYQDQLTKYGLKPTSLSTTHLSSLNSYTSTVNNSLSNLLSALQNIKNYQDGIVNAQNSVQEKTLSLQKTEAGPDELTIRAKKIAVSQKQDGLLTAQQNLADCSVRAPFSGVVAKVNIKKGDLASSGTSLLTMATKQKVAEISLNEVDVAQVKSGQRVTLTFDAVSDLTITGAVGEIDGLGTVSQGVVSYGVKIIFDTQDERVKPGMSVSASIITQAKADVLMISNSAIKTNGNENYVEILKNSTTSSLLANINRVSKEISGIAYQKVVEIGLANDTMTEVISGLKEGDQVITQTITQSASSNSNQQSNRSNQNNSFRMPGIVGGGFR